MLGSTLFCLLWQIYACLAAEVHLYVSPQGSDGNNGLTSSSPFHTIQHAVSVSQSQHRNDNIVIELMAGYHDLEHTLHINRNNIVMRAYNNQEVHVTGGKRIDSTHFKHVTNHTVLQYFKSHVRSSIRVVHLPDVGITNYGTFGRYGFAYRRTAPLEVFMNNEPLHFARWPNDGFINIVEVPDGENGTRFRYNSDVPKSWHHESNPWVYGFWQWSWADRAMKVASLDANSMTVSLTGRTSFGLRTGHWGEADAGYAKQGGYFRFVNILSELDEPQEYYMDTESGNLYIYVSWSNGGMIRPSDMVYVSLINNCIEISQHHSNIKFEGFTLEVCRKNGINAYHVKNITVKQMEIRNLGGAGVLLGGDSRGCTVSQCLIYNTDGGAYVAGGNRKTLESSMNTIENNEIFNFSRVAAVGSEGIKPDGVGVLVRNNHVYFGQYNGIRYYGNDIIMEYNILHHLCMNASDCGGLHTGRDWTTRGNIIRNNIVHDVLLRVPGADCRGVMLDDQSSSTTIIHNVFYDNHIHTNIGGGRDNIISYNVMYNATKASIQVDHRGMGKLWYNELQPRLHAMPYHTSVWTLRYPEMATLDSGNPNEPLGNQIHENIIYNGPHIPYILRYDQQYTASKYFNVTETGVSVGPSDHYDVNNGDLRIKCLAANWANHHNFPQVMSPNEVGPKLEPGPVHLHRGFTHRVSLKSPSTSCPTHAPATTSPVPAYIPDGSRDNDLFNVTKQGCWFSIEKCTDHPNVVGTYRDMYGEQHNNAANDETECLARAVKEWRYCGSHPNEQVASIYGPTGATVLAGDGCFMAIYGCPNHGGPADGHIVPGKIYRDTYAENTNGAAHNETACLARALVQWRWCGSSSNHPVTSIYRPTGASVTAGAGCWIQVHKCPKYPQTKSMFYDAWGATNYHTDDNEESCLRQAEYYWNYCGSDSSSPVTAYYRPTTHKATFP